MSQSAAGRVAVCVAVCVAVFCSVLQCIATILCVRQCVMILKYMISVKVGKVDMGAGNYSGYGAWAD